MIDVRNFVPKDIYDRFASKSIWFIDDRIISLYLYLEKHFNKDILVNNWHTGGAFQNRGYRVPSSKIGASLSQHKFGRAIDINIEGIESHELYDAIIKDWSSYAMLGATTLEDITCTRTWVHLDCRYTGLDKLLIVKP